jgi:HSP20 family protein
MGVDYERSFRLDVIDHDNELVVLGELPGVDKEDIAVTVMGDRLMIEAERKFEEKDEEETYYRHEVGYGKLMRIIALPVKVDSEKIHAELKDGFLEVKLPKLEVAERHTIKVA